MKKQVISDALWVDRGGYFVLRDGRIFKRNWKGTGRTVEIKQSPDKDGYLTFTYKGKTVKSHRFVAESFISNPNNLPEINHRNEKKTCNFVGNLEWCDHSYNMRFGTRNERASKAKVNGKKSKKVCQYSLDGSFIREWPSFSEVKRCLGYRQCNLYFCCIGKYKQAYGYIWRYAE